MDTVTRDELRALRARAYGPAADIEQDASALRRLHELEALDREPVGTPAITEAPADPPLRAPDVVRLPPSTEKPVPTPTAPPDAVSALEESVPVAAGGEGGRKRRLSTGVKILWALSVAASAAAAAAITFGLTYIAPVNVSSGAEQIATLEPSSAIEIPVGWMGAGPSSRFYEFYGLTLFETAGGFYGPMGGTDCFAVVVTETIPDVDSSSDTWTYDGMMNSGCRMGDFPATVEVPVGSGSPEDIRSQFPEDSVLQFVADGDRIGVFLDTP